MRLPKGGLIDRATPLAFRFDGRDYSGFAGDSLASALLAAGVRLFGRSFKYHRPRGVLSAGAEEPNALVELRTGARREPNTPATTIELFAGLQASSQNRYPSLKWDIQALSGLLSPMLVSGFYYKTFMWPASFWEKLYEPVIRKAAGLGRASGLADPDHYERMHQHCDVLVIGAGPAGLAAALAAGRRGQRVVLCESDVLLGGRVLAETPDAGLAWVRDVEDELRALPNVRVLTRTTVTGLYDHGVFTALERVADHKPEPDAGEPRQRFWKIVAREAVLATGAIERGLVFGGNDTPGVMLAGAVRAYLNRYAVAPGRRVVLVTSGDEGWRTVADCARLGVTVAAVVDRRAELPPGLPATDARVFAGGRVRRCFGGQSLTGVEIEGADGEVVRVEADVLAMAGGWSPSVHLAGHLGHRPVWSEEVAGFVPGALPPGLRVVGGARGAFALAEAIRDGGGPGISIPDVPPGLVGNGAVWVMGGAKQKAFVDYQHDVTADDIALAYREGFRGVEHLKRYTTLGMATDQDKTANVNGLALLAAQAGTSIAEVGVTMFRPPFVPTAIGAMAGHHRGKTFRATRLTPGHARAAEMGADFVEAGQWLRAQYFARPGETDWLETVTREVLATRSGAGLCDVSTLGKIELLGRDVGAFLDFVYSNTMSTLKPGRARYGLMLREDGFVFDDGTVARLEEERWVLTTTTANAGAVMQHLAFAQQVLRPDLDVHFASVTDQWAQYSIAGPKARAVLTAFLDGGADVSDEAFPFMAVGSFTSLGGVTTRVFRISFSGELAYEIAVPARHGDAVARRLMQVGEVTPYGTEALSVMRIEKGHPAGGELNGQTTARDLGLARMIATRKDCIGKTMAQRPALLAAERPALMGFVAADRLERIRAGAHFLAPGAKPTPDNDLGWMSSAAYSPMLGRWIGLGFIAGGTARKGSQVRGYDPVRGGDVLLDVVPPCFIDASGGRMRG